MDGTDRGDHGRLPERVPQHQEETRRGGSKPGETTQDPTRAVRAGQAHHRT